MEIQVGTPPEPGRYVVWTPCAALQVREWCEPSIATWEGGRWHTYDPVWGWIGPLPVVHGNDCLKALPVPDLTAIQAEIDRAHDEMKTVTGIREYDL